MRMDDETLKRILKEGMEYDADCIMNEVNSAPNMQDVVAPEEMYANIKKQIQEYKDADAKALDEQAKEEQELIRLGKIYKKKRARRKYIVLIVAVVCALGVGTISFGDGKKVFTEIKGIFGRVTHTRIGDLDSERFDGDTTAKEEDAYEEINEKFGFYPVKLIYLPEGMKFEELIIEEDSQNIRMYYRDGLGAMICSTIWPSHRTTSVGKDVKDEVFKEYVKEVQGVNIIIKGYKIEDNNDTRWRIEFEYDDVQYYFMLIGINQKEVEKITKNLYFL